MRHRNVFKISILVVMMLFVCHTFASISFSKLIQIAAKEDIVGFNFDQKTIAIQKILNNCAVKQSITIDTKVTMSSDGKYTVQIFSGNKNISQDYDKKDFESLGTSDIQSLFEKFMNSNEEKPVPRMQP